MKKIFLICGLVLILLLLPVTRPFLPWLLILACPLVHIFMMKNMHNNQKDSHSSDDTKDNKSCH
ncbi:MAG: DUF2933 domain-containing protein [bacterium]|nr:DUF2933 domain-containing protein [bacterium]